MSDLDAYGSVIDGLREQAKECKVSLPLINHLPIFRSTLTDLT